MLPSKRYAHFLDYDAGDGSSYALYYRANGYHLAAIIDVSIPSLGAVSFVHSQYLKLCGGPLLLITCTEFLLCESPDLTQLDHIHLISAIL